MYEGQIETTLPENPSPTPGYHLIQEHFHTNLLSGLVTSKELSSSDFPANNRVDCLQVRGVSYYRQCNLLVGEMVYTAVIHSQVVLHVTRALEVFVTI